MATQETLPALIARSQEMVSAIIETNGELSPEMEAQLHDLEVKQELKVENYVYRMESFEHQAEYFARKAKYFNQVSKALASAHDYMKERVKQLAVENGLNEILGIDHKFVISNSKPAVEVIDETLIDRAYFTQVITEKLDKKRIEEDLKLGIPVPGAALREVKALRISANKKAGT